MGRAFILAAQFLCRFFALFVPSTLVPNTRAPSISLVVTPAVQGAWALHTPGHKAPFPKLWTQQGPGTPEDHDGSQVLFFYAENATCTMTNTIHIKRKEEKPHISLNVIVLVIVQVVFLYRKMQPVQ